MFYRILLFLLLLNAMTAMAQKEYNVWYFGYGGGLDFNASPVRVLPGSAIEAFETSSGICDSAGNVLLYTNGDTIYNRYHFRMLNSHTGADNGKVSSCVQGTMVVKMPGSYDKYYVFHGVSWENVQVPRKDSMLKYSIVDMKGDNGLGEVVLRDQPLFLARQENFGITSHANGKEFWIMAEDNVTGMIHYTHTVNGQFDTAVMEYYTGNKDISCFGNLRFSHNSSIISTPVIRNGNGLILSLFRFNNATGEINELANIKVPGPSIYGTYTEFSPDSRFLYVVVMEGQNYSLYQYDLESMDIEKSRYLVMSSKFNVPFDFISTMQVGPDGKIYVFHFGESNISVINCPNKPGSACNFVLHQISVAPAINGGSGPYFPIALTGFHPIDIGPDRVLCEGDSLTLTSGCQFTYKKLLWSTGDTTESIQINKTGMYTVEALLHGGQIQRDTMYLRVGEKSKVFIGNDTSFCSKFSLKIKPAGKFQKYLWSTGEKYKEIIVNKAGIYSVSVVDSNSCASSDTIQISEMPAPIIKVWLDTVDCLYTWLAVDTIRTGDYRWSNGDSSHTIKVTRKGTYSVQANHQYCHNADTVVVDKLPKPVVNLPNDTSRCLDTIPLKITEPGTYLWSTGEISDSILISTAGQYWVKVTVNQCSAFDTINIRQRRIPVVELGPDVSICRQPIILSCNEPGQYLWSTGESNDTIHVASTGKYWLSITNDQCTGSDTIEIDQVDLAMLDLGQDTGRCNDTILLSTTAVGTYLWNTGEKKNSILVSKAGIYWLNITDRNCIISDTINIVQWKVPEVDLGPDTMICKGQVPLSCNVPGRRLWSTGETTDTIYVSQGGKYILKVSDGHCNGIDSINVIKLEEPLLDLGPDLELCTNLLRLESTTQTQKYLWNTGETTPSIFIQSSGNYWLTVSNLICETSDTIIVHPCEGMNYYIPNSFSPNGDQVNDFFSVFGSGIVKIEMEIFNRWGEKVFTASGNDPSWDGTYKDESCHEAVYCYKITLYGKRADDTRYVYGTLTLLR